MEKGKGKKNIEDNFIFDDVNVSADDTSAIFRLNKYCGQMLINGEIDFLIAAEDIKDLGADFWAVKKHGQWGVVHRDELTKWIIKPKYDYIKCTFDNYFIVAKYHKYGIININNEIVLDFIYDDINSVFLDDENRFIVKMNGRYGIININRKIIVPFIYDKINNFYCSDNTEAVLNGKYGIINKNGTQIKIDKKELSDMIKVCETKKEVLCETNQTSLKDAIIKVFDGNELQV